MRRWLSRRVEPVEVMSATASAVRFLTRAFGGALAVHQHVIGDAVGAEELAHEVVVLGGDAQAVAAAGAEGGGGGVEIGHVAHIDPEGRHGDDEIGEAEAHRGEFGHQVGPVGHFLAHEILAGDAEMQAAGGEFAGDLAGREQHELDAVDAAHGAAVFAARAGAGDLDAARTEPGDGVVLEPALGGHAEGEGHGAASPAASRASGRMMPPTALMARPAPSTRVSAS